MLEEITQEQSLTAEPSSIVSAQQALINYISYSQEVKSKKIDAEILKDFSTSAKKAINFSDNWFKETTFVKSAEELKIITKTTLDNFKEYFQEKLLSDDSKLILNNLGSSGDFFLSIPNPPNTEALISTMQEYSGYLVKLVALLETKNLEKDEYSQKVLDSLAIFPGKTKEVNFACLQGTSQRIKDQSMALDKINFDVQAVKNSLLTETSQLAPSIYAGNQVHLEPCLLYMLHINQQEISKIDGFYSTPIKDIKLEKAVDFVSNFSKKFDENLNKIVDDLYDEDYSKLPLTSTPADNDSRNFFIMKLNMGIPISPEIITSDIFKVNDDTFDLTLLSKEDFKRIILSKIKDSQQESQDFLRDFLTPEKLFHQDTDIKQLDITKIDNLLNLFASNRSENEQQKQANIAIGIKTLNLLAEKFKNSNILFLACFFEKFEQKIGEQFEDFFYQTETAEASREIKPEYEKYKNIIESTLNLYKSNLQKYYGSEVELLNHHKEIYKIGTVSDQEDEDLEKKTKLTRLISLPNFMKLKSGESNIIHYPRQFFEKNTIKFILKEISRETLLSLTETKLISDTQDPLNNFNPIQIATYNKDQEMLSIFLNSKITSASSVDDKFEFIKNNNLLSISLNNNDFTTFNFLLGQIKGVNINTKIKDGIDNQDEKILEILALITKRGNRTFFNAFNFTNPLPESLLKKLTENALKNDNPELLRDLKIVDISPHLSKINYKSENIIKSFFDRDFIANNHDYIKNMSREAMENCNVETVKHLTANNDILDHFNSIYLQRYLIKSIVENKIEISKIIIEQMLKVSSELQSSCSGRFKEIGSSDLNRQLRLNNDNNLTRFPDGNTYSYLEFAYEYKRTDIAEFLIEKGVKISDNCFKMAIKAKDSGTLNLLINTEMKKSNKTKLAVLKEKSSAIFNKLSRHFDFEILKNLFEDLSDSDKKELLNFNVRYGIIRSNSTVYDKILESNKVLPNDSGGSEILDFIKNLHSIKDSQTPLQITQNRSGELLHISNQNHR
jgi:hypothetical protein